MEKIVSTRNYAKLFKNVPPSTPRPSFKFWAILGGVWLGGLLAIGLVSKTLPQASTRPLTAPPSDSDSISVQWTPTVPDGRIWVDLTPGRSGLTN